MFKKTIEFEDFNGNKASKTFYFHMSKADFIRLGVDGTMAERLKRIVESQDNQEIYREFEQIIRAAVGVKSDDGSTFVKDEEAQAQLFNSPAYDELIIQLVTDPKASTEFMENLLPAKMQKELQDELLKTKGSSVRDPFKETTLAESLQKEAEKRVADLEDARPAYQKENREPTEMELLNMSHQEMVEAFLWREKRNK